ncbi:hypothetical protein LNO92_13170 [Klebsiella variicola subsp. variicola]|nr:hypothetical protein [Klebsiella variicola subsp. variicola]
METGEHYLCHPYFKKIPQQTPVFVFVPSDSCARVDRLPLCLRDACFISINADLRSIKKQIANRLTALSKSVSGVAEKTADAALNARD